MELYKVKIAYDGSEFCGFQRQVNARTVQEEIEKALRQVGWNEKSVLFSGRTDRGVHAESQVIAFPLEWTHSEFELVKALNAYLPTDISALNAESVEGDFHPRYDARRRIYRYQIYEGPLRNCLLDRCHWRVWPKPDLDTLLKSTAVILGRHDFKNFGKPEEGATTVRTIEEAEWKEYREELIFRITSKAFLYHMVRRIVYLLVKAGQNKITAADIAEALEGRDHLPAGIAPANGLFLERIVY